MKLNLSLKQSWTLLILITVIVPTTAIMLWFGCQLYTTQLNSALQIEQQANEALRDQIQSEVNRLKTVFHNKSDPLIPLIDKVDKPSTLKEINRYLDFIIEREPAIREIMIFSSEAEVIAVIDPNIGITKEHALSAEKMQTLKGHLGFDNINESPEFVIPLLGRDYISSPQEHDGFMAFTIAVPIGNPAKAVLAASIDIDRLWRHDEQKEHGAGITRNYILDRRGSLITTLNDSKYKLGHLMTHFSITRSALINKPWQTNKLYLGINNQPVFGTITTIPTLNWTLVSEVIASEITRPIWTALVKAFVLILLGLVFFIWAILYLAKKTIRPIQNVCRATDQVARGDYQIALEPCGIQELDVLALNFNLMAKLRKKEEEKLQLSDRVFRETHDGIIITDSNGTIVDVNPTFCEITGYSREEVIGENSCILRSGKQSPEFYADMWKTINEQGHWQGELWNRKKSGELYAERLTISILTDDNSSLLHYVGIFSDITHNKQQQEKLELMAHYDVLTQLPNRVLFTDRFIQAIAHSKRTGSLLAVCFLDLDHFKPVNDNYGHEAGDQLLIEVAGRITANIRDEDTVSRQGGDEFAILLGDIESYAQCEQTLERIYHALTQPYLIDDYPHKITVSTGITLYPLDDSDIDTLLRHADQAMYQAKQSGRNRYYLFNTEQDQEVIYKHHRLEEIQQALTNNEFCLYYQPKVNMNTGEVFGAEALIRWIHPEKGLIPPLDFLPIIEGTDLEIQIGDWVINQALKQLDDWKEQGIKIEVSVNIASHHLQSAAFITELDNLLAQHPNVDSNCLQLEILESSALSDLQAISKIIKTCRHTLGVNIALDDFGTGYSSLTHLRNLSANTIKIDQTFVRDMLDDPSDYAIIDGVIGLADSFNLEVIAEGVETTEHGLMLLLMGCEEAQGYGIVKPMPATEISDWLKHYIPNEQWIACGNKKRSLKERKLEIFKLTTSQWIKHFETNIQSSPESIEYWPIMEKTKCPCGTWIKRSQQDQLFEQSWLDNLNEIHDTLHAIAYDLLLKYQDGRIDEARGRLKELQTTFNESIPTKAPNATVSCQLFCPT